MNVKERLRRWSKPRFAIMYPFAIYIMIFGSCDADSLKYGIPFIAAGELIRLWANCYAVKSEKLTTSGPYAFMRHPLYLGTTLLAIGFIIFLKIYYAGIILLAVMGVVYYKTIKKEEGQLEAKFKEYADYRKQVPAMLPTFFPYRGGEKWGMSLERLVRSQEYKPLLWIPVLIIAFYLKQKLITEKAAFDSGMMKLVFAAILLISADIFGESVKYWKRRGK